MADESASQSRPISVSEILARSREADSNAADDQQPPREGRGRRRAGRDGAVTVAELTGEIPRVDTGSMAVTPRDTADDAVRPHPEPARPEPVRAEPPVAPAVTRSEPTFPRAENPVARRPADDVPSVDRWQPDTSAGSDLLRPRFSASGMPSAGAPPMSRDFSADAVARRISTDDHDLGAPTLDDEESANAVTGIIPIVNDHRDLDHDDLVGDHLVRVDPEDDVEAASLSGTPLSGSTRRGYRADDEFEDDFDAYRSFSDVPSDEPDPRQRRGLGRWFKGKKADARDERPDETRPQDAEPHDTDLHDTDLHDGNLHDGSLHDTELHERDLDDRDLDNRDLDDDDADLPLRGLVQPDRGMPAASAPEPDTDDSARIAPVTSAVSAAHQPPEAAVTEMIPTAGLGVEPDHPAESEHPAEPEPETTAGDRSPATAWALVIGEAILGLVVGIGLFWGFTELWKWNVYFALVLAVVVIFGIVTLAHIVRRSRDLTTTLLAIGVGLIVTIGPLVLLAT